MISKNDCLILLAELNNKGLDTKEITKQVLIQGITQEVLKFINDNRLLELRQFYERLRKNYNKKHSQLYGNIVKEIEDPNEILTTLSSLLTQILLYAKTVDNKHMFLRHARANEITKVLQLYFNSYDLTNCIKLLRLIKCDLKALENISNS